ncbi:MAG: hypothetical protein R3A45_02740 [Bdellovibrionota bacterium]
MLLDPHVSVIFTAHDGDRIEQGQVFGTVSGSVHALLQGERTALNILQRLSGIATLTHHYVESIANAKPVF